MSEDYSAWASETLAAALQKIMDITEREQCIRDLDWRHKDAMEEINSVAKEALNTVFY